MQKIILLGTGGHAGVLIDLIKMSGRYDIVGMLDKQFNKKKQSSMIPILGNDDLLLDLFKKGIKNACIGVGSVKDNTKRKELYEKVKCVGFSIPFLIHPCAIVSKYAKISEGVQILAGAIISTGSQIEENTIVNTGAIIDHDCVIGKNIHICPGVSISGGVTIGDGSFIGVGSTIIQGINIGKNVIVAAGSLVIKDIVDGKIVKGIPAK